MFALILLAGTAAIPDQAILEAAVRKAIKDEISHGISATKAKKLDQYMEQVPLDYRQVESDGRIVTRDGLRAMQERAWSIIPRTNALDIEITGFELGCAGTCATVFTNQRWDRQMLGRDGTRENNVVTTQRHRERWELAGSRWVNREIEELGGTVTVDGKPYD